LRRFIQATYNRFGSFKLYNKISSLKFETILEKHVEDMGSHYYTTSSTLKLPSTFPSAGQSILCIELVALCAPLSTALFAEMNTRYFPSGLHNKKLLC
jgi:hypothetical protein